LDSEKTAHIRLSGDNILEEHCYFENTDGKVTLHAMTDAITVRGPYRCFMDHFRQYTVLERKTNFFWTGECFAQTKAVVAEGLFSFINFALASASFSVRHLVVVEVELLLKTNYQVNTMSSDSTTQKKFGNNAIAQL
jgi:hypothetical protein